MRAAAVEDADPGLVHVAVRRCEGAVDRIVDDGGVLRPVEGKDLVASRQIWNIACYADAPDTIDDDAVIVSAAAWNTDAAHYLRIFAPRQPGEVGISQRHAGAYDATKYELVRTANGGNHLIDIFAGFVRVEGLQVVDLAQNSPDADINVEVSDASDVRISESILRGNVANAQLSTGVEIAGQARGSLKVWNSVIQGFSAACVFDNTISGRGATTYLYNNTLSGCSPDLDDRFATMLAKNNIFAAIPPLGPATSGAWPHGFGEEATALQMRYVTCPKTAPAVPECDFGSPLG